jgi:parvulin-like peptidyl-prolyl isomerase
MSIQSLIRVEVIGALAYRPRRAILLPALGAVVGLVAAGVTMFRGAPQQTPVVPPGYVALVNQKGILMSDFMSQTATEASTDFAQTTQAERSKVLHEMIDEELLVQRGLALDLPETTTEVRSTLADAVNSQVAQPKLAQPPSEAELRAFYDQHRTRYAAAGSMTVRDLVLHVGGYQNADQSTAQAETDAADAAYQLRSGTPVEQVMEHFGLTDSGRVDNGEQLDFAAKLHLGDRLYQVAESLGDGQVSDPVLDTDGVHILVMARRLPPRVADFSLVRSKVYTDYRDALIADTDKDNLEFLRRDAQIVLAPGQHE